MEANEPNRERALSRMDRAVWQALFGIAGEMQMLAFESSSIGRLHEADLRAATRRALQMRLAGEVVVERPLRLAAWRGLGPSDIAVLDRGGRCEALIELKWCKEEGKMLEGPFDAWKLASAYKEGLATRGYLIAGAPLDLWETHPLAALWGTARWRSRELWSQRRRPSFEPGRRGPSELPAGFTATRDRGGPDPSRGRTGVGAAGLAHPHDFGSSLRGPQRGHRRRRR